MARALAAGLMVSLSTVGLAGTSAWLIVRAAERPVVLALSVPMGLVQLFALAKAAGRYVERTQTHRAALGVMGVVRARVARTLEPLVPAGLGPRSAEVVELVVGDVERVQDLLSALAGPLVASVAAGLVTVVVSGLVVPATAPVLLGALVVVLALLAPAASRLGRRSERESDEVRAGLVALFADAAQAGDEFATAGAAPVLWRRLDALERRVDAVRRRRTLVGGVVTALGTLVAGGAALGALGFSALALRDAQVGRALVAVPVLLSVAVLEMVGALVPAVAGLGGDRAALGRLGALEALVPPVREPDEPAAAPAGSTVVAASLTLGFGDATVLSDASLDLAPGDLVTIEGPSGGGKTSLARLLARLLDPSAGSLDLDDTPYARLPGAVVRERVGLVDDAPYVFAASLAANLRVARPDASDDDLRDACAAVGLSALVASRPEGLAMELGGATVGLSGGERRRLGVARELLVARPVALFDEPTEGLDEESAREVTSAIAWRYRDRAVLVVSHRDGFAAAATRRLRLESGRLVAAARDADAPAGPESAGAAAR